MHDSPLALTFQSLLLGFRGPECSRSFKLSSPRARHGAWLPQPSAWLQGKPGPVSSTGRRGGGDGAAGTRPDGRGADIAHGVFGRFGYRKIAVRRDRNWPHLPLARDLS